MRDIGNSVNEADFAPFIIVTVVVSQACAQLTLLKDDMYDIEKFADAVDLVLVAVAVYKASSSGCVVVF